MDNDIFEGMWKQLRGEAKKWVGKLADDNLNKIDGKLDKLMSLLHENYGYTVYQAAGGRRISKEDKSIN